MAAGKRLDPIYRAVLLAFGLFIAYLLFRELATFLIAILITILISIPLSAGATQFQRRLGLARALGAFLTLLLGLGALAGLLYLVIPSFVDEGKKFVDQLPGIVTSAEHSVSDLINAKPGEVGHTVQHFVNGYVNNPGRLAGPAAQIGLNIVEVIAFLVVIILTAFYIAVNPQPLVDGILLYIGLRIIGLDYALVFAVLPGLFPVIPYFGAIAAGIPPVLFALSNSLEQALLVLGIYILTHEIEGNVSVPLVMANRVRLHPAMVAIGVVIVGALFGFVGLFVAVPILALVTILIDELWVKPMNARKAAEAGGERVTAHGLALPATVTSEEAREEVGARR